MEPVLSQKSEKKDVVEKLSQESKKRGFNSVKEEPNIAADELPVDKRRLKRTADVIEEECKSPAK